MEINEFNVPVPWGHVAVKTWGRMNEQPVLMVHGLQDNLGSFDFLIPLLPDGFYYVCIDLPGHGKSSHFPPHLPIYSINNVYVCKLILDYFKRKEYTVLGHSYGAQIGVLFAQIYPEYVSKLILLDAFCFLPIDPQDIAKIAFSFKKLQQLQNIPQPTYSYEEILKRIVDNRVFGQISMKVGKKLLERTLIQVGEDKYKLSTDQRLKHHINPMWNVNYITDMLKHYPLQCPTLLIIANETPSVGLPEEIVKQHGVIHKRVEGNHNVHMLYPERVSPLITSFLLSTKTKCKL